MVYIIQGKIAFEKPAFDMTLADGKSTIDQKAKDLSEQNQLAQKVISESLENQFKKSGLSTVNATFNLSEQRGLEIAEQKLFLPKEGWEEYLTQMYCLHKEYSDQGWKAAHGEILLYQETRIPSPWIYLYASGNLIEQLYVEDGRVHRKQNRNKKENAKIAGLFFDFGSHDFRNPKGLKVYEQRSTKTARGFSFK
ncbi:hypothetical protein HZA97_07840 [Candidatus Woesearchaeota archaeon]|nr:hypothetical protein [Candidatus Woesearchaeota archaeon]